MGASVLKVATPSSDHGGMSYTTTSTVIRYSTFILDDMARVSNPEASLGQQKGILESVTQLDRMTYFIDTSTDYIYRIDDIRNSGGVGLYTYNCTRIK
jgi:hypothetical protein